MVAQSLRTRGMSSPSVRDLREHLGSPRVCYLCSLSLLQAEAVVDHVTPVTRGGTNDVANLAWAHRTCNQAKRDLLVSELCALAFGAWVLSTTFDRS